MYWSDPYEVDGHQVTIGVSIVIAMSPSYGSDPDTLLKNADIAMYRAKDDGRGSYRFFEPEMDSGCSSAAGWSSTCTPLCAQRRV